MSQKINGKQIAAEHAKVLKFQIKQIKKRLGPRFKVPAMVSFCNQDDPPSVKYTQMKQKKAVQLGIDFRAEIYSSQTPQEELSERINLYNTDPVVYGIMVQLPLPEGLNRFKGHLINLITPQKDVDGLTDEGRKLYLPATVKAVLTILDETCPHWQQQQLAAVGAKGEVGRPLVRFLKERKVDSLTEVDMEQGDINADLLKAHIVISATGKEKLVKPDMVKRGVVLIDVGLGDFDPKTYKKASLYTPRIGGVGPVTVISLMENVIEAFENNFQFSNTNLQTV